MKDISHPQAIFFDWDGTLVDTFDLLEASHNHALASFDLPLLEKGGFSAYFGGPRERIYHNLYGPDRAAEAQKRFEEFFSAQHCTLMELMPGAEKLLDIIAEHKIPIGVVSNKKPEFVNDEIAHLKWTDRFVTVVGGGEAKNDKPAPDPLFLGVKRAQFEKNLAPQNIWYVGDSMPDLACANGFGAFSVFIGDKNMHETLINTYNPALVFNNCYEFTDFFSKIR